MAEYAAQAEELDGEILAAISRWRPERVPDFDFNNLAMRIFNHQLRYNAPYARFCAVRPAPRSWEEIPPVPAAAFKEAALCTFDPSRAQLVFETSGTTQGTGGRHYMETSALYDAALLTGFAWGMLADDSSPLRYFLVVPNPAERPQSSLGYMMERVAQRFGAGSTHWFLRGDDLLVESFIEDARDQASGMPVCLAGTAFGLLQLCEALHARGVTSLPLPAGSRIMETGGFKGRTRTVTRGDLYAMLERMFDVPPARIVAEYGMTELSSQYYDATFDDVRIKRAPPWLRSRVVNAAGETLPAGTVGTLVHVDLANRSSCVAIMTEDLGVATEDGGIILLGRDQSAELRGCSLDGEQLRTLTGA